MNIWMTFYIVLILLFTQGCSNDENIVDGGTQNNSLLGNWSTNGYQIMEQNDEAYEIYLTFTETDIAMNIKYYYYNDSLKLWIYNNTKSIAGTYTDKNSFIRIKDNHGAEEDDWCIWHYDLGENLVLNSAWDDGGIYTGTSDQLTSGD